MGQDQDIWHVYKATRVKLQSHNRPSYWVSFVAACVVSFIFPLTLFLPSDTLPQQEVALMFFSMAIWVFFVVKVSSAYGHHIGGSDPGFLLKSLSIVAALSICMTLSALTSSYIFFRELWILSSRYAA